MSDDEDVILVKKSKGIHYGSLEEQEKARLAALAAAVKDGVEETTGKDLGDVNISNEYMDLEDEISKDKKLLLEEFERRRKARQLNVSTDDDEVRRSLRQLAEPVCLFGEGPAERRKRLRDLLSYLGEDAINKKLEEEEARIKCERDREGTWYHEGPAELKAARLWIAQYSLPRAEERLQKAREEQLCSGSGRAAAKQEAQRRAAAQAIFCSQIGDTRPISYCRFSSDGQMLITSSWSGLVKVWSVPDCVCLATLKGHSCNVSAAVFAPNTRIPSHFQRMVDVSKEQSDDVKADSMETEVPESDAKDLSMASCSYDGVVNLWNFSSDKPLGQLEGHSPHRVSRLEFHPSGRFLGTCVFDHSWRLWDLETGKEVLHQEGHAKPVYCIDFQCDGSLAVTGGMDAFGRVWDLRTGRCVMFLEGHLGGLLAAHFAPSGRALATAAEDHTVKLWDLRSRNLTYTVPAHTHLVSDVRYEPVAGHWLASASYDGRGKLWSSPGSHPLRTLAAHDNKIMSLDISPDSKYIATSSYDRTFKLWTPDLS